MRDSDPFLPVLPSPEISKEPLEDGLNTSPETPLHSPHAFLKEDRWLFYPPPVVSTISTQSEVKPPPEAPDETISRQNSTPPCHGERKEIQKHLGGEQPALHYFPYHWKNTHQEKY